MNAPVSRRSVALLIAGAVAVLLLGAFSRLDLPVGPSPLPAKDPPDLAIEPAGEPEFPAGLSPGLAEIVRLAQAHVDENVILAFIRNSSQTYSPTANEILYLSDLGLSQTVIAALFKQQPPAEPEIAATTDAVPAASAPPASAAIPSATPGAKAAAFYDALAPYGTWTQSPDYGLCWQPTTETLNPDWRPYVDQGQWLFSDNVSYWQSDYSWGSIAFHYGRWTKIARLGWVWVPDAVWGPAWVSWRVASSYSGWAPLPPGVGLAQGLPIGNQRAAANSIFPPGWFTFVSEGNLLQRNLPRYAAPASQEPGIFIRSVAVKNYSIARRTVPAPQPARVAISAIPQTEPPPALTVKIPAREIESAVKPQVTQEDEAAPLVAGVALAAAVNAFPQSPDIAVPLLPPLPAMRRHHLAENYPGFSTFGSISRWQQPFAAREFFHHDLNAGSFPGGFQPPQARTMSASVPAPAKSGK